MSNVSELIWKDIAGFEGVYQVSNDGQVKRLTQTKFPPGKILKPSKNKYIRYVLSLDDKLYFLSAHRLVATAFVPNPLNMPFVNHLDGNKWNNNDLNLEWTDHAGNTKHAVDNGLMAKGERNPMSILSDQEVNLIRTELMDVPNKELAIKFNVSYHNIWDIKNNRTRT